MKRFLRILVIALLLVVAGGMLTWYFIMKRSVPMQAVCIPKNAIAVLTLNLRELAIDHSSGQHLFPGMEDPKNIPGTLSFFLKAAEQNDGSGISETKDVLGFFYQDGEAAFIGFAAVLNDKEKFSKLVLERISKNYPLQKIPGKNFSIVRFDSTSAVLGWNEQTAVFLYPFSDHGGEDVARQCAKLLAQTPAQSVLADENFKTHELSSFDAGLWVNAASLLHFTGGGKLAKTSLSGLDYVSFNIDFREGETEIRRIVTARTGGYSVPSSITSLPCDPKEIKGFWKFPLAFSTDELKAASIESPPLNQLPFSEEELEKLLPQMDGSCMLLLHDTVSYQMPYIGYTYDEDFNQQADTLYKSQTQLAMSYCFGLKDAAATVKLLHRFLGADSDPLKKNEWIVTGNALPARVFIAGNVLVYSEWPACESKTHPMADAWMAREMEFPAGDYLAKSDLLEFIFLNLGNTRQLLSENLGVLTILNPLPSANKQSSEIRLQMKNQEVNALVQLEDIFRKGI